MTGDQSSPPIPMDRVVANELSIVGSHGMAASEYPALMSLILAGRVDPGQLVSDCLPLAAAIERLPAMDERGIVILEP